MAIMFSFTYIRTWRDLRAPLQHKALPLPLYARSHDVTRQLKLKLRPPPNLRPNFSDSPSSSGSHIPLAPHSSWRYTTYNVPLNCTSHYDTTARMPLP